MDGIAGKKLRAVVTASVGYDNIDVEECRRRGMRVGFAGDILTEACAEFGVTLLLATSRRLLEVVDLAKTP